MTANERRQKTEGETSPDGGNHVTPVVAAEANNDLSEDSFYRVAVEKIMEKERLGVASHGLIGGSGSGGDGGDGGDGGKSGAGSSGRRRISCSGRSHDRSRKGAAAGPLLLHLPRGAAAGRRTRTKVSGFRWKPVDGNNISRIVKFFYGYGRDAPSKRQAPVVGRLLGRVALNRRSILYLSSLAPTISCSCKTRRCLLYTINVHLTSR